MHKVSRRVCGILLAAATFALLGAATAGAQVQLAQTLATGHVSQNYQLTIPISASTTIGNRLVLAIADPGITQNSVRDTKGNAWTRDVSPTSAQTEFWSAQITTADVSGDSVIVSFAAPGIANYALYEFNGIDPTSPVDTSRWAAGSSATTSSDAITSTASDDLLLSALQSGSGTFTPPSDQTLLTDDQSVFHVGVNLDAATGAHTGAWSWTTATSWYEAQVAYRANPAPPGIYVSPSGSDSNACTNASPCATINHGISVATSGQTVYVESGVYHQSVLLSKGGLTLKGYGSTKPVIDGDNTRPYGIQLVNAGGDTIDGFEIRNMTCTGSCEAFGIYGYQVQNSTIKNNDIHAIHGQNIWSFGIMLGTNSTPGAAQGDTIKGNTIHDIGPGGESMGVWLLYTKNITVDSNSIYDVRKEGIRDWVGHNNTFTNNHLFLNWVGITMETTNGGTVANNVAYDNVWGLMSKHVNDTAAVDPSGAQATWGAPTWVQFWHNTMYGNTHDGIGYAVSGPAEDYVDSRDNVYSHDGDAHLGAFPNLCCTNLQVDGDALSTESHAYSDESGGTPTYEGTLANVQANQGWETHGQNFNPQFTDPVNGDFSLTNGSTLAVGVNLGDQWGSQVGASNVGLAGVSYTPYAATVLSAPPAPSYIDKQRASNGSDNAYWLSNSGVTSGSFVFDLGAVKPVNIMVMDPFMMYDSRLPKDVSIDVSNDNATWTSVLATTNPDDEGSSFKYLLPAGTQARYVRFNYTSTFGGTSTVISNVQLGQLG